MGVKEVLERGVKLRKALKDQRLDTSSKPSDMKIPDIPLDTDVGGVGLTLSGLMKKENLTYHDACAVYMAYQESLTVPKGPTPKAKKALKDEKAKEDKKGGQKRKALDGDDASPIRRKNAKEDLEKPTPSKKGPKDKNKTKNTKDEGEEAGEATPTTRVRGKTAQAKSKQGSSSKTWSGKGSKSGSEVSKKSWSKKAKVKEESEDCARDEDQENQAAEEDMESCQDNYWQHADTQPDDLPDYPDFEKELAIFNEERRVRKLKEAEAALEAQELDGEELGPETQALLFGDMEVNPVTKDISFGAASCDNKASATQAKAPAKNLEITPSKNLQINPDKNLEITPSKNLEITPNKNLKITPDKGLEITLDANRAKNPSEVLLGCASIPTLTT